MDNYHLEATDNTPEVKLNSTENHIVFSGDSRPEDVRKFYLPIIAWLDEYEKQLYFLKDQGGQIEVICDFKFEYFNSSSAKYLMDIMLKLGALNKADNVNVSINWFYDEMDEDMLDSGEEFADMLDMEFNFKEL